MGAVGGVTLMVWGPKPLLREGGALKALEALSTEQAADTKDSIYVSKGTCPRKRKISV